MLRVARRKIGCGRFPPTVWIQHQSFLKPEKEGLLLIRSYRHVRSFSHHVLSGGPVVSHSMRELTESFPKDSPYRMWSRSFASDSGDLFDAVVPHMGESITDGTLATFLKKPGDRVESGDAIAQVETDKVTIDINSPDSGVIEKLLAKKGDTVTPGTKVAIISRSAAPSDTHVAPSEEKQPTKQAPQPSLPAEKEKEKPKVEPAIKGKTHPYAP